MRKGGARVRVSLTVSPVLDSTHGVIGASAIAQDMTEQKRMEEALREAEALRAVASVATAAAHARSTTRSPSPLGKPSCFPRKATRSTVASST